MGDHSRANGSAPIGQNPEHSSVQGDQNHHPEALVRVSPAECCGRKENAGRSALSQCHKLPLQVTSKDCLLANTGGNGERYPKYQFDTSLGEHGHIAAQRGDVQEPTEYPKQHGRNDPEPNGNSDVPQHLAERMPMISENEEDRNPTTPHTRHYQNEQEPFKEESDQIKAHAVRISRHAQLIRRNLMRERPTAQCGEHQNRVQWASDLAIAVRCGLSRNTIVHDYLTQPLLAVLRSTIGFTRSVPPAAQE